MRGDRSIVPGAGRRPVKTGANGTDRPSRDTFDPAGASRRRQPATAPRGTTGGPSGDSARGGTVLSRCCDVHAPRPAGGVAPGQLRWAGGVRDARPAGPARRHRGRVDLAAAPQGARPRVPSVPASPGGRASASSWWIGSPVRRSEPSASRSGRCRCTSPRGPRAGGRRSSSGRSSSPPRPTCSCARRCAHPVGCWPHSAATRPAGVAGRVEAATDRLLGGAGAARRHGVLQRQHVRRHAGRPDHRRRTGTWSGRRTSPGRSASWSPAGSPTSEVNRGVLPRSDRIVRVDASRR